MDKQLTVFVGLSGGVDSSVAAARLQARGYKVVGVFIKVWHPEFLACNWEQERLDAMRAAAHLNVPFLTCDAEAEYRDQVAKQFINEYKAGKTPNPDVLCNQQVKFGAFLRFAVQKGADLIATGHYAQRVDTEHGPELHRGIDEDKDQTYFLWALSKDQLAYSLFPIGDTQKEQIRKEALKLALPVAKKKDSQGICFLGQVDVPKFLSHYTDLRPGNVLNEAGEAIGRHRGALSYTLGQRHGFSLHTQDTERQSMFVIAKDLNANTVTVAHERLKLKENSEVSLRDVTLRYPVKTGDILEAQFRYRQRPFPAKILGVSEEKLVILPQIEMEEPAVGQSCVLYKSSHCLGGGIITP